LEYQIAQIKMFLNFWYQIWHFNLLSINLHDKGWMKTHLKYKYPNSRQ